MPAWGGQWCVQNELDSVTFAPGVRGPWLFVAPVGVGAPHKEKHSRWVHATADADFGVAAA